MLNQIFI